MKMNMKTAAAAAIVLCFGAAAHAAPLYSFESPAVNPDGFGANGGGVTVSQTTVGATDGTKALNISVVGGATFVGALTGNVAAGLTPPLPIQQLKFDYTITTPFAGAFALAGVTMFGASQPDLPGGQQFGLQAQFADFEHLDGVAAGTYTAVIDLTSATNQVDFSTGQSYNQIFGSGPNQQIPTGFQIFINKSGDAPISFSIDNVRLTVAPEPTSLLAIASVGGLIARRRRRTV